MVVGCSYGKGRRGGQLSEFLLALAAGQRGVAPPTEYVTFCKCGPSATFNGLH